MNQEISPADPDAILAAWRALVQAGTHLHQPQVAARLGIPEACLAASRCGEAATRLEGDVAAILGEAAGLGKVLIAVPHHAGVAIAIAKAPASELRDGHLTLRGDGVRFRLRVADVDSLYTLIDPKGPHGRERHLQLFDAQGHGIGKLLVLYKSQESGLRALGERWKAKDQTRQWGPIDRAPRPVMADTPPVGLASAQPPEAWLSRRYAQGVPLRFRFQRASTELEVICTPTRLRVDERRVLHVQHPAFRLHARLSAWGDTFAWGEGVAGFGRDSWIGCQALLGGRPPGGLAEQGGNP